MNSFNLITVPTFSDFVREVAAEPPPGDVPPGTTVRLVLTERTAGQGPVRFRKVTLDLQGLNHHGLIWLSQEVSIQWANGPLGRRSASRYEATSTWHDLVKERLEELGYHVAPGRYVTPADWLPINGAFDCVRWDRDGDTVTVHPVWEQQDPADSVASES